VPLGLWVFFFPSVRAGIAQACHFYEE